ncbi:MAG: hypothetical protein LBM96_08400 [Methanobrevibacter sp.]|nr:hypothetical protein [Candidatus Methanoflexus mossambicus]
MGIFVEYSDSWLSKMINSLEKNFSQNKPFVFLYGPAGTGKSTFLHYVGYIDNDISNKYHFDYINLIRNASSKDEALAALLEKSFINDFLNKSILKKHIDIADDNIRIFNDESKQIQIEFENFIFSRNANNINIRSFLNSIKTKYSDGYEELLLYIHIINKILLIEENKKIIFVLDNLDELSQIYIAHKFLKLVMDIYSRLQTFFETSNIFNNLLLSEKVCFLCTFRDVNYGLLSLQIAERLAIKIADPPIMFENEIQYSEILEKRKKYFDDKLKTDISDNDKRLRDNIEIVESFKNLLQHTFLPLFNFGNRALTRAIIGISRVNAKNKSLLDIDIDKFKKIKDYSHVGAKGVLYSSFIRYLMNEDVVVGESAFSEFTKESLELSTCHYIRMGFTILSNLSGVASIKDEGVLKFLKDEDSFITNTNYVYIKTFYDKLKIWYDKPTVKKVILSMAKIWGNSHDLFMVLEDLQLKVSSDTESIANAIEEKISNIVENENNQQKLKLRLTPACVIYAHRLFIHYEYFNLLSYMNYIKSISNNNFTYDDLYNCESLFQKNRDKENLKILLNNVYNQVEKTVKDADKCFCDNIDFHSYCRLDNCLQKEERQKNNFCKNAIVDFKNQGYTINGVLYVSRVISSHLHYLDEYRKYILTSCQYDEEKMNDIHSLILSTMKRYIDLYYKRDIKGDIDIIIEDANKKIKQVKDGDIKLTNIMPVSENQYIY